MAIKHLNKDNIIFKLAGSVFGRDRVMKALEVLMGFCQSFKRWVFFSCGLFLMENPSNGRKVILKATRCLRHLGFNWAAPSDESSHFTPFVPPC